MPSLTLLDKFTINRRQGTPMHAQILRALREIIDTEFEDGDAFFTETEMAAWLGVSRATVRQALGELSREGILRRRPALGTVVVKTVAPRDGQGTGRSSKGANVSHVGVFIPQYDSEVVSMLLQKMAEECRLRGLAFHTYYTYRGEDVQSACRQIHRPPAQERFLLLLPPEPTLELSDILWNGGCRTVALEAPSRAYPGVVVKTDSRMAVQIGVDHLRALSHERITLLVNEPATVLSVQDKIAQFRQTVPRGQVVLCGTAYWESSFAAAYAQMGAVWETNPTAIMTVSDPGAWAVVRWLNERRISVPGEVSVLGFEDARSSRFMHPSLSTIAHPIAALARTALDLLWQHNPESRTSRLPPELLVRESTGPAPEA